MDMDWNEFWWIYNYFAMNFILKFDGDKLTSD